jgi:hypothetical protein
MPFRSAVLDIRSDRCAMPPRPAQRQGRDDEAGAPLQPAQSIARRAGQVGPGIWDARGTAAKFFRANDALEAGQKFVTDTSVSDPTARRVIAKMTPAERRLFAQGFAGELAERLGARGYSANIINNMYLNSPRAQQRISTALGPQAAAQFEAVLRIESIMNKTRNAIGGSQTSTNLKGMGLIERPLVWPVRRLMPSIQRM